MSSPARSFIPTSTSPCVLVVDDDRRVLDLLNIALAAHGYRVVTAADGEEAVRVALGKRPDLVVLDVRLPKKSGLEVCEILRQDPDDPFLPIIMVSAASETEARLQGFARGADDYVAKPFSPKELVARIKRLLARANEARESRRRGREAEVDLGRARDEVKRAHVELRKEQRLRQLASGTGRDLHGALDAEQLASRFLISVRVQVGVSVAALLVPDRPGGPLVPAAIRGDGLERLSGMAMAPDGELATLLAGMGRPVRCSELLRFGELRAELPAWMAKGVSLMAPIRGADGLEGVLVADERRDGEDANRFDVEVLALLCDAAAVGLANARRCRALADGMIETLVARADEAGTEADSSIQAEAASWVERAAGALLLPPRLCGLIGHGVALGSWAQSAVGRHALALAAETDLTGRLLELTRLVDGEPASTDDEIDPRYQMAATLVRVAREYAAARHGGAAPERALTQAMDAWSGQLDEVSRRALAGALRPRGPRRRSRAAASGSK